MKKNCRFVNVPLTKQFVQTMKTILQILFWAGSVFFAYMIYNSINGPIAFDKVKKERYAGVISKLKDVRDAQVAHRTVTGKYAKDFPSLIQFIDTAKFTIVER